MWAELLLQQVQLEQNTALNAQLQGHAVICGYGRVGQSIARFLQREHLPFIALDDDPVRVEEACAGEENVHYGDSRRRELLEAVGIVRARLLVVAVDGPAMGGGFGLACCGDLVLATQRSVFATPEVTLGLPPAQIAPFVWQRLGDRAARECLLSGRHHSALEAQALGLVNAVVADGELEAALADTLARYHRSAPGAVAATKQLLRRLHGPLPDLRDEAAIAFASALRGPEAAAGLQAFARKQPAPWAEGGA